MTDIGEVIGWKFNHQQGMSTREGVITAFPGGIPTQAEQDLWTAEYEAYLPTKAWKESMAGTDAIPRWADDIFDALPLEIRDVVNPVTKSLIINKKAQRELRPV